MYLELPRVRTHRVSAIEVSDPILVINRHPGPGEEDVPVNSTISLTITSLVSEEISGSATKVWVNDVIAFDARLQEGFDGPRSSLDLNGDTFRIVLDPLVPFESESTVTVRVVSATLGGAYSLDTHYSFVVEDRTAPQVVSAEAVSPKTVRLEFNEAVTIIDPVGFSFIAQQSPAVAVEPVAATATDTVVEIILNTEMTPGVQYEITITGVVDLNDNPLQPPLNTVRFIGFRPAVPARRRFQLWDMIPKHNRREDDTGDLWRFIACLQEVTDLLLSEIDRFPDIFDIERAPETFLDLILLDLGNPFLFNLNAIEKARLASILTALYRQSGTEIGIVNAIRFFLGIEVEVLPFTADLLDLGEAEIGVNWILGPSDRAALYTFDVRAERVLTDVEQHQIRTIVNYLKTAHTHFAHFKMPSEPAPIDSWTLGVSELGITSRLN
jgi:phage tail-like protein